MDRRPKTLSVGPWNWATAISTRPQVYGNEGSVGGALAQSGVPRDQLFVTTKFNHSHKDPAAELERSLQRLGLECVDLYLIHWPQRGPIWAWPGMERALGLHRNAKRMLEHVWAPSRAGVGRLVRPLSGCSNGNRPFLPPLAVTFADAEGVARPRAPIAHHSHEKDSGWECRPPRVVIRHDG